MATIPEVPPEQKIVPVEGGRKVTIPTYEGGNITPSNNFTIPYQSGESTAGIVKTLAAEFNKVADEESVKNAAAKGYLEQQKIISEGNTQYLGGESAFSKSAQAYQKGATLAYSIKKKSEGDIKLEELFYKRPNDLNAFKEESEKIKGLLLDGVPSSLMADISLQFDQKKLHHEVNISKNVQINSYQDNLLTIENDQAKLAADVGKLLNYAGDNADGEALSEAMAKMQRNTLALNELGLHPKEIYKINDQARQQLFASIIGYQDKQTANDPAASQKLRKDIESGLYTFGKFGEDFGDLIPGGKEITLREAKHYKQILDHYDKERVNQNAGLIAGAKSTADETNKLNLKSLTYVADENGNLKLTTLPFNEIEYRALGMDTKEIAKMRFDYESHVLAAQYTHTAKTIGFEQMGTVIDKINEQKAAALAETNPAKKNLLLAAAVLAEKEVPDIIAARQKAKLEGTEREWFKNNAGPLYFPSGIDVSTAEGNRKFDRAVQNNTNSPLAYSKVDSLQGTIEYDLLKGSTSVQDLSSKMEQGSGRQQEYYSRYISAGIDKLKGAKTEGEASLLHLHALKLSRDEPAFNQLASAYLKRKENIIALESRGTEDPNGDKWRKEFQELRAEFRNNFGDTVNLSTPYGQAMFDSYENIYIKNRAGRSSISAATNAAEKFIKDTNATITVNGTDMLMPKNHTMKNGVDLSSDIQKELEDMIKNPHRYNIVPGPGETYSDLLKNKNSMYFTYTQEHALLKNKRGDITQDYTFRAKLPSDEKSLIFAPALIAVKSDSRLQPPFKDREGTWEFTGNFSNGFKGADIYKGLGVKFYDTEKYGRDLQKHFIEKIGTKENTKGEREYNYYDWVTPLLVGKDNKKTEIALAISVKAKENKLEENDLLWLGNNVPYLRELSIDSKKRQALLLEYTTNFDTLSKQQSKGMAPTRMSPLQVITDLARKGS
jgi:hypothetical protein